MADEAISAKRRMSRSSPDDSKRGSTADDANSPFDARQIAQLVEKGVSKEIADGFEDMRASQSAMQLALQSGLSAMQQDFANRMQDLCNGFAARLRQLEGELQQLHEAKQAAPFHESSDVVTLNVGGSLFTTSRSTLRSVKDSMLDTLVSGRFKVTCDAFGNVFIDRSPKYFSFVLDYLRGFQVRFPIDLDELDAVEEEFEFYGLPFPQICLFGNVNADVACVRTLTGHKDSAICLAATESVVISGSCDHTIKIWDLRSGECKRTLTEHKNWVRYVHVRGNLIASASDDKTIKLWDLSTGECLRTITGHSKAVRCVLLADDSHAISGSADYTVRLWSVSDGQCVRTFVGHSDSISSLALSGQNVLSGSWDNTIRVWDMATGHCLRALTGHTDRIHCMQVVDHIVVSGSNDKMVRCWDMRTGDCLKTLSGHTRFVFSLQVVDNLIMSGSLDSQIRVWDMKSGQCLRTLSGHTDAVCSLGMVGNTLVSGSADYTIKVWSAQRN